MLRAPAEYSPHPLDSWGTFSLSPCPGFTGGPTCHVPSTQATLRWNVLFSPAIDRTQFAGPHTPATVTRTHATWLLTVLGLHWLSLCSGFLSWNNSVLLLLWAASHDTLPCKSLFFAPNAVGIRDISQPMSRIIFCWVLNKLRTRNCSHKPTATTTSSLPCYQPLYQYVLPPPSQTTLLY